MYFRATLRRTFHRVMTYYSKTPWLVVVCEVSRSIGTRNRCLPVPALAHKWHLCGIDCGSNSSDDVARSACTASSGSNILLPSTWYFSSIETVLIDEKENHQTQDFHILHTATHFTRIKNVRIHIPHHRRRRPQDGIQRIKVP